MTKRAPPQAMSPQAKIVREAARANRLKPRDLVSPAGWLSNMFGNPIIPDGPALTLNERRKLKRRDPLPAGYAALPGTGPAGETCGTCRHHAIVQHSNRYHKCGLMRQKWTGGVKTDIRVRSPACREWGRGGA